MHALLLPIALLLLSLSMPTTGAAPATNAPGARSNLPAQVLMIGTFHFHNPGLDLVKTDVIDVTTPANQAWLERFAGRLARFAPTVVLVETLPERDEDLNANYDAWRTGQRPLGVGELEQIGFRVARAAGLDALHGFDQQEVGWEPEAMWERLPLDHPDLKVDLDAAVAAITDATDRAQRTLTLAELLARANAPDQDRINRNLYLVTNAAGAGSSFLGADASASWWHRNLRMYANVQRWARPGERVLVIGGQGHTAIMKQLLDSDLGREAVALDEFLADGEGVSSAR